MNRGMTVVAIPNSTAIRESINYNTIKTLYNSKSVLPAKVFITKMADMAAIKTVDRECLIAIMAAMKNVLSPNSDTIITETDAMNA